MKIGQKFIGKVVKLVWVDPAGPERMEVSKARKGRAALARWVDYGIVDDITEGVIRLKQSEGWDGGMGHPGPDEASYTWTVEDLVESIEILEAVKDDGTKV